jgi:hypothetical protein
VAISASRKVAAVMVPWAFLGAYAALYAVFVVPRLREGALLTLCAGAFIALVFVVFFVAAITFSRDVLTDRWP